MSSEVETSVEFEVRDNGVQANLTLPADDAKVLRQLLASHAGILEGDLGAFEGVLATALSKDLAKVKKPTNDVETTIGFELKDDGIEVSLTLPLADAKALQRSVDHLALQDVPPLSDKETELAIGVSSILGTGFDLDLPAVAEELKQQILS
jgi:hypothetical protein